MATLRAPWLLRCSHTHLYPGAQLRHDEEEGPMNWRAGDSVLIMFSDLSTGQGMVQPATDGWQLDLAARQTARGLAIARQTWCLQTPVDLSGALRVARP